MLPRPTKPIAVVILLSLYSSQGRPYIVPGLTKSSGASPDRERHRGINQKWGNKKRGFLFTDLLSRSAVCLSRPLCYNLASQAPEVLNPNPNLPNFPKMPQTSLPCAIWRERARSHQPRDTSALSRIPAGIRTEAFGVPGPLSRHRHSPHGSRNRRHGTVWQRDRAVAQTI